MVTTDCQQTVEILANKPEKAYTAVFIQEDTKDVAIGLIALCCQTTEHSCANGVADAIKVCF